MISSNVEGIFNSESIAIVGVSEMPIGVGRIKYG